MMKLMLNGDAKNKHVERQGIYILGKNFVNNHPYWGQQNGSYALWFVNGVRYWILGGKIDLGQNYGWIAGPSGIDRSPTQIVNGWRYAAYGRWLDAYASEIMFKDLTTGIKFSKLVIHYETINFHIFQLLMILVK